MVNRGGVGAVARVRVAILLAFLGIGGLSLLRHDLSHTPRSRTSHETVAQAEAQLAGLPLAFEPNRGQTDSQVKFLTHGSGYTLFLARDEAMLAWATNRKGPSAVPSALKMKFVGASAAEMSALQPLPGRTNYLLGNDSSRWVRNVPQFARVQYRQLYPGVDLDFYGKEGRLEYDFEVNPGADPASINLQFADAGKLRIAANGDLLMTSEGRELRFHAPHLYQASPTGDENISGNFVLRAQNQVGFEVGSYDRTRTLVIDPVLTFSTYFGGSGAESCAAIVGAQFVPHCPAVAVDSANRIYLAGTTTSVLGFPTPTSAVGTLGPAGGSSDIFVSRISSNGSALVLDFLTFLGGSSTDYPVGVGVDSGFNVYLAGNTSSSDFPTTSSGYQTSLPATGNHVFFSELSSSFGNLLYSTFLGGNGVDTASDMALDAQGRAYIFGTTTSTTTTTPFPTTLGALQSMALATNQFFLSKLNPNLVGTNSLLYSTFIGGSTPSNGVVTGGGVAVDANLNVYVAGGTNFTDMPTANAYQNVEQGGLDVWAAKLSPPASNTQQYTPLYETYYGGSGDDVAYGVASDSGSIDMYITGSTTSVGIPSVASAPPLQATYGGGASDAFLTKFGGLTASGTNQGAVQLLYFTYLGGTGQDAGLSVVADTNQNARIAGFTTSGALPNSNPLFQSPGGGADAFFARIVTIALATTTANTSSTSILGGSGTDLGTGIALDAGLDSYIAGETSSPNFPHTSDPAVPSITPLQSSLAGASDAFVSKIGPNFTGLSFICTSNCPANPAANPTVNPSPVGVGSTVTFTYSIYNFGDPVNGAILTDTLSANSTLSTNPSCTQNGSTVVCNLGTIPTSTTSGTPAVTLPATSVSIAVIATAPAPTTPPTKPPDIGNSAVLTVPGTNFQATASGTATVNDFGVSVAGSNTQTITAGNEGTYTVVVTPTGVFPESVSLSCGSGLPSGGACTFQGNNPISNLNNGAQSRTLDITTTPRVTTPARLSGTGPVYAFWLPVSGLALIGGGFSRRRLWLIAIVLGALLGGVALQAGCSSATTTSTTTGTPAGTYTVTVNAVSGGTTRTTAVTLVVK